MQLAELVVQGVRRFSASQKIAFRPGLNVLLGPNESGKSTLAECVRSLLYPQSVSDPSGFVSPESPQVSRAALTFTSADGAIWRVLRDYVTGNATLAKLNSETKKFETAESGAAAVEAKVRELGAPSFDLFEALYFLKADKAPWLSGGASAAPAAPAGAWGGGGGGAGENRFFEGSAVDVPDENLTPDQIQEKVETLKRELESSEKLAKLQFELDGIEAKKFEAENKLSVLKEMEGKVSQAKGEMRAHEDVAEIDPALEQRLTRYEQTSKTHNQEMARLDERKTHLEGESKTAKAALEPIYKNPILLGGAGASLLSIILGIAINGKLVFLLLPALGAAGAGFYLWNDKAKKTAKLEADFAAILRQRAEADKKFEVESAVAQELLKKLDVRDVKDVLERKKLAHKAEKKLKDAEAELAKMKETPDVKQASDSLKFLSEKSDQLQSEISQYGGGMSMDPAQIKREIKSLEDKLKGKKPSAPRPMGAPTGGSSGGGGGGVGIILQAAAVAAGTSAADFGAARGGQLLSRLAAFTGGKHPGGGIESGEVKVAGPGGAAQSWAELPGSVREAAYLSVVLGSAEALTDSAPFVWDDAGAAFDDERLAAVAASLKALLRAKNAQALWVTSRKELAAAADHLIRLAK